MPSVISVLHVLNLPQGRKGHQRLWPHLVHHTDIATWKGVEERQQHVSRAMPCFSRLSVILCSRDHKLDTGCLEVSVLVCHQSILDTNSTDLWFGFFAHHFVLRYDVGADSRGSHGTLI